jgi:hypothetical protein
VLDDAAAWEWATFSDPAATPERILHLYPQAA